MCERVQMIGEKKLHEVKGRLDLIKARLQYDVIQKEKEEAKTQKTEDIN